MRTFQIPFSLGDIPEERHHKESDVGFSKNSPCNFASCPDKLSFFYFFIFILFTRFFHRAHLEAS